LNNYRPLTAESNFSIFVPNKILPDMKKMIPLVLCVFTGFMISCGPSAEEKARMEQARQDSINQAMEQARQDSVLKAMEMAREDSIRMAMAMQDSINKALQDSLALAQTKKTRSTKTTKTTTSSGDVQGDTKKADEETRDKINDRFKKK
jgi:hypothetical protein